MNKYIEKYNSNKPRPRKVLWIITTITVVQILLSFTKTNFNTDAITVILPILVCLIVFFEDRFIQPLCVEVIKNREEIEKLKKEINRTNGST